MYGSYQGPDCAGRITEVLALFAATDERQPSLVGQPNRLSGHSRLSSD